MMEKFVADAVALWPLDPIRVNLAATRENHVYRVECANGIFALRFHRPGYRSDDELRSELLWMRAAADGGLNVPSPLPSTSGVFLHVLDNRQVDVLSWLPGRPLGANGVPLDIDNREQVFHDIGREMARLHEVSDRWQPPVEFTRWSWDRLGLLGEQPVWDRFWDNPTLAPEERSLLIQVREAANRQLAELEDELDYGLIHADLLRENVILDGERVQLIDFDDGGYGFRLFDVATTLLKNLQEPDYKVLESALLRGYRSVRPMDTQHLGLFLLLRSLTYVGWIIQRLNEDNAEDRNRRNVGIACKLARDFLG